VVAGKSYVDEVWGAKVVSAGAVKETAAGNVETSAASGTIHVTGGATITAAGKIQIDAASVTVKVSGSLTAKGGSTAKLSGKLAVDGGTTKLDASTTARKSTSKVEA